MSANRVILALDFPSWDKARPWVNEFSPHLWGMKVGLELFISEGPDVVRRVQESGARVFLDLKLCDIPNTVEGAVESASKLGVSMLTLHALGGRRMMRAAAAAGSMLELFAVTLLTSFSDGDLAELNLNPGLSLADHVVSLTGLAAASGLSGVICSAEELARLNDGSFQPLKKVTPGIRFDGERHDQRRVVTPKEAFRRGADRIVMGRALTEFSDPKRALDRLLEQLSS